MSNLTPGVRRTASAMRSTTLRTPSLAHVRIDSIIAITVQFPRLGLPTRLCAERYERARRDIMTDPLRSDRNADAADPGATARRASKSSCAGARPLLSEQHELAINVWTRVLFFDRGHARARAYIERRSALNERSGRGRLPRAKRHSGEGMLIRLAP